MYIFLTNDDGINAEGLLTLAKKLSANHKLIIVAPDTERSAVGHSLTMRTPLRYKKVSYYDGIEAYEINGMPADCVKFGIAEIIKKKPDLIISGINHGSNLGTDIMYSGTVSAAFEACYLGYKAVAVSCYNYASNDFNFEFAADFIANNIDTIQKLELPVSTIINVNYPSKPAAKAIFTAMGIQEYDDTYVADATDSDMFWLKGQAIEHMNNVSDCDVEYSRKNYATITPIRFDMTNYAFLQKIKKQISFKI